MVSGTNWLKEEVNLFLGSGSRFPEVSSREKEEYPGRLGRGFVDFVKSVAGIMHGELARGRRESRLKRDT